jgi:hypothetical protein
MGKGLDGANREGWEGERGGGLHFRRFLMLEPANHRASVVG